MTVYVDDMRMPARVGRLNGRWSHLMADTTEELLAFAARIGLKRCWIQHEGEPIEHFDVTDSVRAKALRLGAVPVKYGREGAAITQRKREAQRGGKEPRWAPPAVSVRQPWAWAILHAGKTVENRRWATGYRGELLIHAGKTVEDDAVDVVAALAARDVPEGLPTGGVVGRVRLVDVHHADDCYMTCSPWAQTGCWHWVLGDVRPERVLRPCPGRLGLFRPRYTDAGDAA